MKLRKGHYVPHYLSPAGNTKLTYDLVYRLTYDYIYIINYK